MTGPYGSALLNDLHTHFPDLLYHSERFTTVPAVLDYLQQVARRSPYEEARTAYLRAEQQEARRAERDTQRDTVRLIVHPRIRTEAIFSDFLQTLLPQLRPSASAPASAPATEAHLEDATLRLTAIQSSECAICQDTIEIGQSVRMIRHCTHRFHQECLDPWLERHTTCPTCRHNLLDS